MSRECCGDVEEILSLDHEEDSGSLSSTIIGRLACSPELDCQIVDDTYADPPSKYYTKAARRHHDLSMYMEHINQTLQNQRNDDSNNKSKVPQRTSLPSSLNSLASSHTSFHSSTTLSSRLRLRRDSRKTLPHAAPSLLGSSTHPQQRQKPPVNREKLHTEEQVEDVFTRPSDIVQERRPEEVPQNQTETKSGYNNNNMVNIDVNNRNSCRTITTNSRGKNTELVSLTNESQNSKSSNNTIMNRTRSNSSNNSNSTISNNGNSSKNRRNTIANGNTQRWSDRSSRSMTFDDLPTLPLRNENGYSSPSSSTEETSEELMPSSSSLSSSSHSPPISTRRAASTSVGIPSPSSSPTNLSAAFRFSSALSSNPYLLPPLPPSLSRVSNGYSSVHPSSSLNVRSSALYSAAVTSNLGLRNSNPLPPHWRAADWNDQGFSSPSRNSENIGSGIGWMMSSIPSTTVGETPISSRASLNSSIPTSNIRSPLRLSLGGGGGDDNQQQFIHLEHQQQPRLRTVHVSNTSG